MVSGAGAVPKLNAAFDLGGLTDATVRFRPLEGRSGPKNSDVDGRGPVCSRSDGDTGVDGEGGVFEPTELATFRAAPESIAPGFFRVAAAGEPFTAGSFSLSELNPLPPVPAAVAAPDVGPRDTARSSTAAACGDAVPVADTAAATSAGYDKTAFRAGPDGTKCSAKPGTTATSSLRRASAD